MFRPIRINGDIYKIIPNPKDDCEMMSEYHRLRESGYDLIFYERDNYPEYRFIGKNLSEIPQEILDA